MQNRGKFTIGFKVKVAKIIRETSSKFDGPNTKMDEIDIKC
ncbi:hypothetical protein [Wolbachia endosymbiont (group A) of Portevinia maculata]